MATGSENQNEPRDSVDSSHLYDQKGWERFIQMLRAIGTPTTTQQKEPWPNPWPQPIPGKEPLYPLNVERWADTIDTEEGVKLPALSVEQHTPETGEGLSGTIESVTYHVDDGKPYPKAKVLVEEALDLVFGERNDDYGHPAEDYGRTAGMWSAFLGVNITPYQAALMMVMVKLSREYNKHKDDNIIDSHGYLLVASRIKDREEGRE